MKWAIELGEHDIEYHLRRAIKRKALSDFLVEIGSEKEKTPKKNTKQPETCSPSDTWKMYVDGSSTTGQCGAGVLLISP